PLYTTRRTLATVVLCDGDRRVAARDRGQHGATCLAGVALPFQRPDRVGEIRILDLVAEPARDVAVAKMMQPGGVVHAAREHRERLEVVCDEVERAARTTKPKRALGGQPPRRVLLHVPLVFGLAARDPEAADLGRAVLAEGDVERLPRTE